MYFKALLRASIARCLFESFKSIDAISSLVKPISSKIAFVFGIVVSSNTLSSILLIFGTVVSVATSDAKRGSDIV